VQATAFCPTAGGGAKGSHAASVFGAAALGTTGAADVVESPLEPHPHSTRLPITAAASGASISLVRAFISESPEVIRWFVFSVSNTTASAPEELCEVDSQYAHAKQIGRAEA